jgi:hypothetical protein
MTDQNVLRELASEIAISLLCVAPGPGTIVQLLPDTSRRAIRKLFGADRTATLEGLIQSTLQRTTDDILAAVRAEPKSDEYGATFSAIQDFKDSLSRTKLTSNLLVAALAEPAVLENAIRENCPQEHKAWASRLRRTSYDLVLQRFTAAILAVAPQVPTVQTAVAIETYRQVVELRSRWDKERDSEKRGGG